MKNPASYAKMKLFLSPDGHAGFALNGDDIVSVFNHARSAHRGSGDFLIQTAISAGGRRLDAFDTELPHIYARNGFAVSGRMKWNDEYAPEGWDYKRFEDLNGGRPDVLTMHYDPKRKTYLIARGSHRRHPPLCGLGQA